MATIKLEIVTAEGVVFSDDVDAVVAPGIEGELGILPHHTPLMTMLSPGELRIVRGVNEHYLAVSGGFLEVRPDHIIILADAAERAEEIDITRAEAAKERARQMIRAHPSQAEMAGAQAALQRSLVRLKVGEKLRRRGTPPQV
jgi:F-type H+-transporting ATPase subunit epsilon